MLLSKLNMRLMIKRHSCLWAIRFSMISSLHTYYIVCVEFPLELCPPPVCRCRRRWRWGGCIAVLGRIKAIFKYLEWCSLRTSWGKLKFWAWYRVVITYASAISFEKIPPFCFFVFQLLFSSFLESHEALWFPALSSRNLFFGQFVQQRYFQAICWSSIQAILKLVL